MDKIEDVTLTNMTARTTELSQFVRRTPTIKLASEKLKKSLSGAELFLKLECIYVLDNFNVHCV